MMINRSCLYPPGAPSSSHSLDRLHPCPPPHSPSLLRPQQHKSSLSWQAKTRERGERCWMTLMSLRGRRTTELGKNQGLSYHIQSRIPKMKPSSSRSWQKQRTCSREWSIGKYRMDVGSNFQLLYRLAALHRQCTVPRLSVLLPRGTLVAEESQWHYLCKIHHLGSGIFRWNVWNAFNDISTV